MLNDIRFQPSNEETALHMTADIFNWPTSKEMLAQAKGNRRHAMAAWRGSPERNGLGKALVWDLREFWTPEQKAAEKEAFDLYDRLQRIAKAKIQKFAEDVIVVQKEAKGVLDSELKAASDAEAVEQAQADAAYLETVNAPLSSKAIINARLVGLAAFRSAQSRRYHAEGKAHAKCAATNVAATATPRAETIAENLLAANELQPLLNT